MSYVTLNGKYVTLNVAGAPKMVTYKEPYCAPYCAEALAYFARMDVQPATGLKDLLNEKIVAMKSAGIYENLYQLVFMNLHTAQASTLNVIGDYANSILVNSPTFTEKYGFDVYNDKYIRSGFDAPTAKAAGLFDDLDCGHYFVLNNYNNIVMAMGVYNVPSVAGGIYEYFGTGNTQYAMSDAANGRLGIHTNGNGFSYNVRKLESNAVGLVGVTEYSNNFIFSVQPAGEFPYGNLHYYTLWTYGPATPFNVKFGAFGLGMDLTKRLALKTIIDDFNTKITTAY
jgi:hypothetical protein